MEHQLVYVKVHLPCYLNLGWIFKVHNCSDNRKYVLTISFQINPIEVISICQLQASIVYLTEGRPDILLSLLIQFQSRLPKRLCLTAISICTKWYTIHYAPLYALHYALFHLHYAIYRRYCTSHTSLLIQIIRFETRWQPHLKI